LNKLKKIRKDQVEVKLQNPIKSSMMKQKQPLTQIVETDNYSEDLKYAEATRKRIQDLENRNKLFRENEQKIQLERFQIDISTKADMLRLMKRMFGGLKQYQQMQEDTYQMA